jgi:hypothetical protein
MLRRVRHRYREAERDAKPCLGKWERALQEWVHNRERKRAEREQDRQPVQLQHQHESSQKKQARNAEGLPRGDHARSERAVPRAFDVCVEITIGEIVHGAPGGTNEHRPEQKNEQDAEIRNAPRREP